MKKINILKESLINLYINQNKTTKECAEIFKCSNETIKKYIKRFNIKKSKEQIAQMHIKYNINKDQLFEIYINQNKTMEECSIIFNIPKNNLEYYIKKFNFIKTKQKIKENIINTNLRKYGCKYIGSNKEFHRKTEQTMIKKYGRFHNSQLHMSDYIYNIVHNKENFLNYCLAIPFKYRTIKYCELQLGYTHLNDKIKEYNIEKYFNYAKSLGEVLIRKWLDLNYPNLKVIYNCRNIIKSYNHLNRWLELDFYIPELNLAIEFNGEKYHSEEHIWKTRHMHANEYHQYKLDECKKKNIDLHYIWESDIMNKKYSLEDKLKEIFNEI